MNVHDSERLSGLLEQAGYTAAAEGADADVVVLNTCAVRENADNRLYGNLGHLRPVEGRAPRHADRRRRLPGAEGPRRDRPPRPVGRRRLRHAQRRVAAGPARPGPAQRRGAGRDRRVARGLPVDAAGQAGLRLLRLGLDQRRLQQHLHVLHRPVAARHGEGPPSRRDPGRGAGAGRPGRARGDPARPERERLRRRVPRPRRVRRPAPRGRPRSRAWSGCGSPARTPGSSPTTSSTPWPRRRRSATSCTCRCSPAPTTCCAGCAAATGRSATSGSSTASGRRCPTRRSPPTSSWASPARPRRTSSRPSRSSGRPGSPAPSPSSTPSGPGRRRPRWTASCPRTSSRSGTCG